MLSASVVVPALNAAATLGECLGALKNQDYPSNLVQIIVVDDGSSDGTADVARALGAEAVSQPNRGPAAARNHGARLARGDILLFTDADCAPAPDWLSLMLAPFDDPAVGAVKGAYRTRQRSLAARFAQVEFEDRYARQAAAPSIDFVDSYAAAFRRQLFLDAGGYDERFPAANNEDVELSYRLAEAGTLMRFAPDAIVYHRHQSSVRRYLRTKFWRGYWRMLVYKMYPGKALRDSYTPQVLKVQSLGTVGLSGLALLGLVWRPARLLAGLLGLALLLTTLPFAMFAARRDLLVGLASPALQLLRSAALGWGAVLGQFGAGRVVPGLRDKADE